MKEWKANTVFHSYLDEVSETCNGIFLAKEARASLQTYLHRENLRHDGPADKLINTALAAVAKIQDGHVVRSLFMSAHAGFEQYLRSLFEAAATSITNAKLIQKNINSSNGMDREAVLKKLTGWQISLAGDAFSRYFEPLVHLTVDYPQVAKAIVQCGDSKQSLAFDGAVFGFRVGNIDQEAINRLFLRFGHKLSWDSFAEDKQVQKLLGRTKKKDTEKEITRFMDEALKSRNRIAHTQGEFDMDKDQLLNQIDFLYRLSDFLFKALSAHITKLIT